MTSIEQTGRTVEDAVKAALKILGVAREDVEVEVLSQESRGLLGILGYSEAKVRVTVKASLQAPAPPPPAPPPVAAEEEEEYEPQPRFEPEPQPEPEVELGPPTEVAARALEVVNGILSEMGMTARAERTREDEEAVYLTLRDEDDLGILIGRRGQTLAALQLISAMIANRHFPPEARKRIILDAADYRARRERALVSMARAAADRARRSGREVPLEPMNARERRIIHVTLANDSAVSTRSEGEEPQRYVVIVPKRQREQRDRRERRYR